MYLYLPAGLRFVYINFPVVFPQERKRRRTSTLFGIDVQVSCVYEPLRMLGCPLCG